MAINDAYHESSNNLADAGEFIADGSTAGTGAAEVFELAGTGGAEIYREEDIDGDGTYEISVKIDSTLGNWHSQKNQLVVSDSKNLRIRVVNISGGPADYYATGMEVDD
jgi:hypothetical protein